jgi:hypothetical protein
MPTSDDVEAMRESEEMQRDPKLPARFGLDGQRAVVATMHGKERVIGPLLANRLGLIVEVPSRFDTDRFGTFTREIERVGSQLDAARAKVAAAFGHVPEARVAIASEGSFGPDPSTPFVALGRELVLLVDRETNLETAGYDSDLKTNFAHTLVRAPIDALTFAARVGFPAHALIVMGCNGEEPSPTIFLKKGLVTPRDLKKAAEAVIAICGAAFIETDMRAQFNPTRMAAIERATVDLVRRFQSICPACGRPGFDVVERISGLPCEWCGEPTRITKTEVLACPGCGHRVERPATDRTSADAGKCELCNP